VLVPTLLETLEVHISTKLGMYKRSGPHVRIWLTSLIICVFVEMCNHDWLTSSSIVGHHMSVVATVSYTKLR
jgi:hypothetical protein